MRGEEPVCKLLRTAAFLHAQYQSQECTEKERIPTICLLLQVTQATGGLIKPMIELTGEAGVTAGPNVPSLVASLGFSFPLRCIIAQDSRLQG